MDAFQLLFLVAVVTSISVWKSDSTRSECTKMDNFRVFEEESFVFVPLDLSPPYFDKKNIMWYKNGIQIQNISSDKKDRVHYTGGALFLLNVITTDSGVYTAREIKTSGQYVNHCVTIEVVNASYRGSNILSYGAIKDADQNKKIPCPSPVRDTCYMFKGNITWYKNFILLEGHHKTYLRLKDATKDDQGHYTCNCTWMYNNRVHSSSGSRELILEESTVHKLVILTPTNESRERFADEGSMIKLNCSVLCGTNVKHDCTANWKINGSLFKDRDGYSQTTNIETEEPSKNTIASAILIIEKVSAEDFQHKFECFGEGYYTRGSASLILKRKESIIPLAIGGLCLLFICALLAGLIKYFVFDLALLFRPYFPIRSCNKDTRLYDAYVVYQTQSKDKITEDTVSQFITKTLPSVLEDKCGYRLFIHGRDDIPGEDRLELVEQCMKQSRRLMVILTPDLGSESVITDRQPASPETSVVGGFDWQVGLHQALVQRELSVILIQLGDIGPQGYAHLPPALQHLIRRSAPLRWPEGSRGAAAWNSRFWKRVRYLMPAIPAKNVHRLL